MNILITVESLAHGGAEHVASLWANGFAAEGHHVDIVTFTDVGRAFPLDESVEEFKLLKSSLPRGIRYFYRILQLRRLIKSRRIKIVIAVLEPYGWWSKLAVMGMNIPVVFTDHNSYEWPQTKEVQKHRYFYKFYLNKIFDYVTVLTEADKLVIGNRLKNYSVLPNPLAINPVERVPNKKKIILAAGRLCAGYTKGFDVLIEAFSRLAQKNDGWILNIAGGGTRDEIDKYRILAKHYEVDDKVHFLGFVKDMKPIYQEASVFVLSSRFEGFGMVLIEAMSQGCACVACDYKGRQKEIIINDEIGLTCLPDNVDSLYTSLCQVVENDQYRCLLQKNAIERSKYYSIGKVMDEWTLIFKKLKIF